MEATPTPLRNRLQVDCQTFIQWTESLSDEQFRTQVGGKWSVAEVMQHLFLSARPVVRLMTGPRDVLLQWGEPHGASRSYEALATAYRNALATGLKAPASVSPRPEDVLPDRAAMIARFVGVYQALVDATGTWTDGELDQYVLPHPALGKLTVREMLDFTSVHTQHHLALLQRHEKTTNPC